MIFSVHGFDSLLSDTHSPISVSFTNVIEGHIDDTNDIREPCQKENDNISTNYKDLIFKWNTTSSNSYRSAISETDVSDLLDYVSEVEANPNTGNINDVCDKLSTFLIEKAKECNICKERPISNRSQNKKQKSSMV